MTKVGLPNCKTEVVHASVHQLLRFLHWWKASLFNPP